MVQDIRGTVTENSVFCQKIVVFEIFQNLASASIILTVGTLDRLGGARSLKVHQEVVGHRSTRFRARRHPQSGPGQPGNGLGKFYFSVQNRHFPGIPIGPGPAPWEGLWATRDSLTVFFVSQVISVCFFMGRMTLAVGPGP